MGMVSYAQNREDVRLARVFKEPHGFYIDVGASDPVFHSITKHFSDMGWRGINVEPRAAAAAALRAARPRDVTVEALLGRKNGTATFYEMSRPVFGEVSTAVRSRAEALEALGHALEPRDVPMKTLAKVCEEHGVTAIDFVSIDVEGAEEDVIAGNDWKRFRPKVVLVEAHDVTTMAAAARAWEPALLAADYVFAADDAVNRFYVAKEAAADLLEPLSRPLSCFDAYEPIEFRQELERARDEARGTAGAAPVDTITRQVIDDARRLHDDEIWATFEGLRSELARLRLCVESYERQVAGGVAAAPGTAGAYQAIGPIWLGLAARATRLSRRYPHLATRVKSQAVGLRLRWRRLRSR